MLEGLEISEVLLSNIDLDDRIDSEFFEKEDLRVERILKKLNSKELRNYGKFIASAFYPSATHLYKIGEIPFMRCVDSIKYPVITKEQNNLFERIPIDFIEKHSGVNTLNRNDIIITKVGTPSYPSIIYEHDFVALSRTVLGVKSVKNINPFYLLIFLRSKFGFSQLQRHRELTIQYQLTLERTKRTLVYDASKDFQKQIETIVHKYISGLNSSKQTYAQAENLLLEELDLVDFTPSQEAVNIKDFSASFGTSGRLDAEYYQPKYEDFLKLIFNYKNGFKTIEDACVLKAKNYKPEEKAKYKYIELSNVGNSGEINGCTTDFGAELPSRARRKVNAGDVIISSIEGSLNSCALVTDDYDNSICSTGFYVINSEYINSETLLVLFKSKLMQSILKQNCSGTILTSLNKNDFNKISIPIVTEDKQQQIAELIEKSFALKKQSEHLLAVAKTAVEMAIEQNEEVAMEYINKETE